jgi:hypothetical protein
MTRDEILALKAGRSLNVCVAEKIIGHKVVADQIMGDTEVFVSKDGDSVYGALRPYSEDLPSAQLVISKMTDLGHPEAKLWENEKRPDVICRAALLAQFDKENGKNRTRQKSTLSVVK